MGRERFLFLPFPRPVGPPFGILTYPVGRVGVIHPSAWKGNSQKFAKEAARVRCKLAARWAAPLAQLLEQSLQPQQPQDPGVERLVLQGSLAPKRRFLLAHK